MTLIIIAIAVIFIAFVSILVYRNNQAKADAALKSVQTTLADAEAKVKEVVK
jgi:uncharacterized protein YoxC